MIQILKERSGWEFAVIKGDDHHSVWAAQHQSLVTDRTVPDRILPHLKDGFVVVDAGANVGSHTVAYAQTVGPTGAVHAFEPFLDAYVCLAFNVRDLPQVKLYHCALGNEKCRVKLITETNAGATRIVPKHSKDIFNELPSADVITLDSLALPRLNFMKVDVEGYEPLLIRGALETIKRCHPILFIEINKGALAAQGFSKAAVLNPLIEIGYKVEMLDPNHHLDMPQLDIFMIP